MSSKLIQDQKTISFDCKCLAEVKHEIQKLPEVQEVTYGSRTGDIEEGAKLNLAKIAGA